MLLKPFFLRIANLVNITKKKIFLIEKTTISRNGLQKNDFNIDKNLRCEFANIKIKVRQNHLTSVRILSHFKLIYFAKIT